MSDLVTPLPITDPPTTTVSNPVMTTSATASPQPSKFDIFYNQTDIKDWWILSISIVDDVWLSFRGNPIANNSIVLLSDIGDNMDSRILCITSNPDCCARSTDRLGFWYFPSGREVSSRSSGDDIYRTRSGAKSKSSTKLATVMLGRQNPSARGPTGLYHCIIPDRSGVDQTLIVGIYSSSENSELPIIKAAVVGNKW